jgi:hypothetical protein
VADCKVLNFSNSAGTKDFHAMRFTFLKKVVTGFFAFLQQQKFELLLKKACTLRNPLN